MNDLLYTIFGQEFTPKKLWSKYKLKYEEISQLSVVTGLKLVGFDAR
jgi:membrane-associated PAP2 superfamily phosphatase